MTTPTGAPQLFALEGSRPLAGKIADALGVELADHREREFEDGEHKTRPLVPVRGRDVYVIHSLHSDPDRSVHDRLCRLLFFAGALRDAGAGRITAVVPYLCYGRKDRKTKPRDPVTTRYVARLFEAVEIDRVVAIDVHNVAAYQNAFRCATEHLEARPLFVERLVDAFDEEAGVAVLSPDAGGVKRARRFRESLEAALGRPVGQTFMEKYRSRGEVSGEGFVGDVDGRTVLVVDDLISSGTTMKRAAEASRERGAASVHAIATHGLFVDADEVFADPAIDAVWVTDTVPPFRLGSEAARAKLTVVSVAGLLAEAIRRLHEDGDLVELADG
ncbi:MAG: ribose-phosphate pyrophosphokinase [Gemmatimonadota bacterium]|nr:ribose-phosphate pyrophosphokinase [Gemmatimonadota bacterium]